VASPSTAINLTLAAANTGHLTLTGVNGAVIYTGNTAVNGGTLTYAYQSTRTSSPGTFSTSGTGRLEFAPPGSDSSHVVVAIPTIAAGSTGTHRCRQGQPAGRPVRARHCRHARQRAGSGKLTSRTTTRSSTRPRLPALAAT